MKAAPTGVEPGGEPPELLLRQAAATLSRRLRGLGVPSPRVSIEDPERGLLRLELPGTRTPAREHVLQSTGRLELKLVEQELGSGQAALERLGEAVPEGMEVACERPALAAGDAGGGAPFCYLVQASPVITGADVERARPDRDQFGEPTISIRFTEAAGVRLRRFTAAYLGRRLAILLDGEVSSAPVIQSEIFRDAIIQFSKEEAQDLANLLQAGALPGALRVVEWETISPTPWLRKLQVGLLVASIASLTSFGGGTLLATRLLLNRPPRH